MAHTATSGKQLHCVVVTPEEAVLDETADFVTVPMFDGQLGILPGRAPLIGRLGTGEVRLKKGASEIRFFVDGGFLQVRANAVTLLTQKAVPEANIDTAAAENELKTGLTQLSAKEPAAQAAAHKSVERAREMLRLARKSRT